jgi:hypothetical protein
MDYICIGSNGFAQLGDDEYREKNRIEMSILMDFIKREHPIPEKFAPIMRYKVMAFPHDFVTYHEIVISYDDSQIYNWEDSENEEDQEKFNDFWNFVNEAESLDLESEMLTQTIRTEYEKTLKKSEQENTEVPFKLRLVS